MQNEPIIQLQNVSKSFKTSTGEVSILKDVSVVIMPGETVAIIGPSGSGKSTLLSLIGLLDSASDGEVIISGRYVSQMTENEKSRLRNEKIGFIFQSFELISPFTVSENVASPIEIAGKVVEKPAIDLLLREVGLSERAHATPHTLSGGEKQRVAIARALVHMPVVILADEPTGSLDRTTGEKVLKLLLDSVSERHTTLIIITHDEGIAGRMNRVFEINNGMLHERK